MKNLYIDNYIIDTPLYDIILDIRNTLTNGKLNQVKKPKNDWIEVTCPHHSDGKEEHTSCGVYVGSDKYDYGYFHCFTCNASGPFEVFVSECMDISVSLAKKWLITNYGVKSEDRELNLEEIVLDKPQRDTRFLDKSILNTFQSWHPYMAKRKLTESVCKEFSVKYDPMSECLVFPVFNTRGELYMMTRRSVKNKTFIIDSSKEKPVYLMYYIKEHNIKEVTVCESQINALTLWGYGIPSVATFGCNVTAKQMEEFNKSGLNHIYICYDGDEAGIHGTMKFIKNIRNDILVDVIVMDSGKDVNDISEERFNSLPIMNKDEWMMEYGRKRERN